MVCVFTPLLWAGDTLPKIQWGPDVFGGYASNQIIVELQPNLAKAVSQKLKKKNTKPKLARVLPQDLQRIVSPGLSTTMKRWGVKSIRPVFSFEFKHPKMAAKYGLDRLFVVDVPQHTDTPRLANAFAAHPREIKSVTLDAIGGVAQVIPDDTDFAAQWGMNNTGQFFGECFEGDNRNGVCFSPEDCPGGSCFGQSGDDDADIDAPEAWELHNGLTGDVIIAIVDSGVDSDPYNGVSPHPEFAGRMVPGFNTVANSVCKGGDNDGVMCINDSDCPGSGCIETVCSGGGNDGMSCIDNSDCIGSGCIGNGVPFNATGDQCYHGTHVAGIAAAAGNNGFGVAGVNWGARIMPIDVLGGLCPSNDSNCDQCPCQCVGTLSDVIEGIVWAADHGANVINISLQFYNVSPILEALLDNVLNGAHELGAILVCAAGNNFGNIIAYPAKLDNCLAISATNQFDELSNVSNFGDKLDLAAPGEKIWSTFPDNTYVYRTGTSMAAPHVSGLASLMKSISPKATNIEIEQVLKDTADDLGIPGKDPQFGYGRINAFDALIGISQLPQIIDSYPPDRAIDARDPYDESGVNRIGWNSVDLTFPGDVSGILPEDFQIRKIGGDVAASLLKIEQLDFNHLRVVLTDFIEVGAWTMIQHWPSATSVRIGHLPSDVNGDLISNTDDIFELITTVGGFAQPRPLWAVDLDNSGRVTPADVLIAIDLLNATPKYQTLPELPLP